MSAATRRATKEKLTASPSPTDFIRPRKTNGLDHAFGPSRISDYLPPYDTLPEEFRRDRSPWCSLVSRWFFSGLSGVTFVAKPGIDKSEALGHCATIMRSWEPKHEHKIAGVAWLLSQWFEPSALAGTEQKGE